MLYVKQFDMCGKFIDYFSSQRPTYTADMFLYVADTETGSVKKLFIEEVEKLGRCIGFFVNTSDQVTISTIKEKYLPLINCFESMEILDDSEPYNRVKMVNVLVACDFNSLVTRFIRTGDFKARNLLDYLVYLVTSGEFTSVVTVGDNYIDIHGCSMYSSHYKKRIFRFKLKNVDEFICLLSKLAMF